MNRSFLSYALFLLIFAACGPIVVLGQAQSQPDQKQATQDQDSESNYFQRNFKLSGSIRERWEATDGPFSVTPADSYWISQERLGVLFRPTEWLNFFAQAQDTRVMFYQTTPSSSYSNPFDLHQAWMSIGQAEGPGFFVRIGRQDLVLGSGHLIAATDDWWAYTARNFDVARGSYANNFFKSELVAGSAILVDPNNIDEHKPGDHIYADYNTFPHLLPGASVEPYLIVRTTDNVKSKEGQVGSMDTLALGLRIAGKLPGRIDYNFEPLHEFGSYSNDHLSGAGLLTGAGWTVVNSGWKPRVSTDYTFASGDDGKKNNTRETFDNMYGYNFPMNSLTGQFGWKNLKDLRAGVEFSPVKKLKIKLNGREFWLANINDGLYNASGIITVKNTKATSAHVGESIEMMATAALSKRTTVGFGVGTLFPGEYLKQSNKDQAFIYPYIYLAQTF
jgi:hypothetical protein